MPAVERWTEAKQRDLLQALTGYWAEDIWDLLACPVDLPVGKLRRSRFLNFTGPAPNVNAEIKYVYWKKFTTGAWKGGKNLQNRLHDLMHWMRSCLPATTRSLLERSLHDWEMSFRSFLVARGRPVTHKQTILLASQQFKEVTWGHNNLSLLRQVYRELEKLHDCRSEYDKDIWDFRQLGVRVSTGSTGYKANFTLIRQPWLRQLAKTCLRYRLAVYSAADCRHKMQALNTFSTFLAEHFPQAGPRDLTRSLMIEYFGFLMAKRISATTRGRYLSYLRTLLELAVRMEWGDLPKAPLIFDEDLPRRDQPVPRFIPDQVLEQLFLHLEKLETRWQRMFVVAYEVGMRIGELLGLPFNCLLQDATGDWWIQYPQEKFRQEHTQPISKETAAVIQTQQQELQARLGYQPKFLFPDAKGKVVAASLFREAINLLIVEQGICDVSGALWRFQPHQLRHSFGTRHINAGTPVLVVMRMMGHRSVEMTARYAHLHDTTLKQEFEKSLSQRKLIDVSGRVISEHSPADAAELQWLKKQVDARTLPNGYCALPLVLGECPAPNACLTCPHFRTDKTHLPTHENQLAETLRLVQLTRSKGWTVQAENNERIARNLKTMIASLTDTAQENCDDAQTQC